MNEQIEKHKLSHPELIPYLEIREKYPTTEEFGEFMKRAIGTDEWDPIFLSIATFSAELEWIATAKIQEKESFESLDQIENWCKENLKGRFYQWSDVCFIFEFSEDVITFKSRWM